MQLRSLLSAVIAGCTLFLIASLARAGSVTLAWDANSESDLAGYRIYYGTASRQYAVNLDVGLTTEFKVSGLEEGQKYYFAVTAYDQSGNESDYSEEVSATIDDQKDPDDPVTPKDPDDPEEPPRLPVLYQNYPNPFSATGGAASSSGPQGVAAGSGPTQIRFEVPEAGRATLKIFDALGRELMTLLDADLPAGLHVVYWDGRDANGWTVPSGTYFYRLISSGVVQTKRMSFAR